MCRDAIQLSQSQHSSFRLLYQPPSQGKRDGSTKDEPFAWEAKEFLRKKAVGQARRKEAAARVLWHGGKRC